MTLLKISSNDENIDVVITKDKLLELQGKDSNEIKNFINSLPFYGNEISLVKHRPNREKYSSGKAQEPLIKIDLSKTIKRIDLKLRENPELYKKFKNIQTENKNSSTKNINIEIKNNFNSSTVKQNEINNKENEEANRDFMGNNSIYLMNLFNVKSLKIIKYVDYLIYCFINIIMIIEFVITCISLNNHIKRFKYLSDSYKLLNDIVYIKFDITEAILPNIFPNYLFLQFNVPKEAYYSSFLQLIEEKRLDFVEKFSNFANPSIKLSNKYIDYTSKTNITVFTISNGNQKQEIEPFYSAVNRMTTGVFYLTSSSNFNEINMNNKYTYELMYNLFNDYYITFQNINFIILDDFKMKIKESTYYNIIIFIISFFISFIYLILYWKMMAKLDEDREKPINLFLTIKKQIFENLKTSSENFSNKLLNQFFGNDENEEESQQQYGAKVTSADINIAKFKALNEYKASINKKNSFLFYFVQLIIFYLICNIFLILKYFNNLQYYDKIEKFIRVYNSTQFSQIFLLGRIGIIKQFLYNESMPFLGGNYKDGFEVFMLSFLELSDQFGEALKETSKTKYFLKDEYKTLFAKTTYNNFTEIIMKDIEKNYLFYKDFLKGIADIEIGFKYLMMTLYEGLRIIIFKYFINNKRKEEIGNISELLNDEYWIIINLILEYLAKPWFQNLIELIDSHLYSYFYKLKSIYITIFGVIMTLIFLNFWIIWKRFEDRYIDLIRKSFELINLIPEEIKNIIVSKLNEQN